MYQINNVYNVNSRLLDLIYTDDPDELTLQYGNNLLPLDNHHPSLSICFSYDIINNIESTESQYVFDFKKTDFDALFKHLSEIDWNRCMALSDVSLACEHFYLLLYESFEKFVPKRRIYKTLNDRPWFNKELRKLKNKKNRLHKKLKNNFSPKLQNDFTAVSKELNEKLKLSYENYILRSKTDIFQNPKNFWNFINSKRKLSTQPRCMKYNGHDVTDEQQICDHFADFFQSVYKIHPSNNNFNCQPSLNSFDVPHISPLDIEKCLKNVKSSFKPGPDNVPASVLKYCSSVLSTPLSVLFNLSLKSGVFPISGKHHS